MLADSAPATTLRGEPAHQRGGGVEQRRAVVAPTGPLPCAMSTIGPVTGHTAPSPGCVCPAFGESRRLKTALGEHTWSQLRGLPGRSSKGLGLCCWSHSSGAAPDTGSHARGELTLRVPGLGRLLRSAPARPARATGTRTGAHAVPSKRLLHKEMSHRVTRCRFAT